MISVLCPTRHRVNLLQRSVLSLVTHASDWYSFQMLYAVDADDDETLSFLKESETFIRAQDRYHVSPERHGYGGFHIYANELCRLAAGEWLMLWNDDAVMLTDGWDKLIEDQETEWVLSLRSNHSDGIVAFPVVPKHWVVRIGHFSLNPHNDTWWQMIGNLTDRTRWLDVDVLHDRADMTGNNADQTYSETRQQSLEAQTAASFWVEAPPLIAADADIILTYLKGRDLEGAGNG